MSKEEIKEHWQPKDNTRAAELINEKYGPQIHVTKWAVRAWLKSKTNSSPLSAIYLAAFTEVINNRNKIQVLAYDDAIQERTKSAK